MGQTERDIKRVIDSIKVNNFEIAKETNAMKKIKETDPGNPLLDKINSSIKFKKDKIRDGIENFVGNINTGTSLEAVAQQKQQAYNDLIEYVQNNYQASYDMVNKGRNDYIEASRAMAAEDAAISNASVGRGVSQEAVNTMNQTNLIKMDEMMQKALMQKYSQLGSIKDMETKAVSELGNNSIAVPDNYQRNIGIEGLKKESESSSSSSSSKPARINPEAITQHAMQKQKSSPKKASPQDITNVFSIVEDAIKEKEKKKKNKLYGPYKDFYHF